MALLSAALALVLSACDYTAERVHEDAPVLSQPSLLAGTPGWSMPASLASARGSHTAILLPQGKLLVVGGNGPGGTLASAEVYDPATGSWATTGSLFRRRVHHTATLLPSGRVLVSGGFLAAGTSELYGGTGANPAWRPDIANISASAPLTPGSAFTVNGSRLHGVSEASGGNSRSSSTGFPFLTLLDMERGRLAALPS